MHALCIAPDIRLSRARCKVGPQRINNMTSSNIPNRLVELCRQNDYLGAQRELYAQNAVSVEPEGSPNATVRGLDAIMAKTKAFEQTFEIHGGSISDPIVAGAFFACTMTLDVTERKSGHRMTLSEICVYEVDGGKIIREQFFYQPRVA